MSVLDLAAGRCLLVCALVQSPRAMAASLLIMLAGPLFAESETVSLTKSCQAADVSTVFPSLAGQRRAAPETSACFREMMPRVESSSRVAATASLELQNGSCPATSHDVVAHTIAELRAAVASSPAGAVVGVQGDINIDDDAGGDLVISVEGLTLTCASDDAAIGGTPTVALLRVHADHVTIDSLTLDAGVGDAVLFSSPGADPNVPPEPNASLLGGAVTRSVVTCGNRCVNFYDVIAPYAGFNSIEAGEKERGINAAYGEDAVFSDNTVTNCSGLCIGIFRHENAVVERNTIFNALHGVYYGRVTGGVIRENRIDTVAMAIRGTSVTDTAVRDNSFGNCDFRCVLFDAYPPYTLEPSTDLELFGNTSAGCNFPGAGGACFTFQFVDRVSLHHNVMSASPVAPDSFLFPTMFGVFQASDVRVFENTFSGGGSGGNRDFVNLDVVNNVFSNCQLNCVGSSLNARGFRVVDNDFTAFEVPTDRGIDASHLDGPDNMIENNTIRGLFASGIFASNPHESPDARVSIQRNEIDIQGGDFGDGIYLFGLSNSTLRHNRISIADDLGTWGIVIDGDVSSFEVYIDGDLIISDESNVMAARNVIANNSVLGGEVGLVVNAACSNSILGNNLRSTLYTAAFSLTTTYTERFYDDGALVEVVYVVGGTGDNAMAGRSGVTIEFPASEGDIVGDGYLDCDGDGFSDPNIVSGTGLLQKPGLGRVLGRARGTF